MMYVVVQKFMWFTLLSVLWYYARNKPSVGVVQVLLYSRFLATVIPSNSPCVLIWLCVGFQVLNRGNTLFLDSFFSSSRVHSILTTKLYCFVAVAKSCGMYKAAEGSRSCKLSVTC